MTWEKNLGCGSMDGPHDKLDRPAWGARSIVEASSLKKAPFPATARRASEASILPRKVKKVASSGNVERRTKSTLLSGESHKTARTFSPSLQDVSSRAPSDIPSEHGTIAHG